MRAAKRAREGTAERQRIGYNIGVLERSLSIAGLVEPVTEASGPRGLIAWAASLGYRAVQIDGTMPGVRARELDRSGRRDLAALLKRQQLRFGGIDLWVPPAHFVEGASVERAIGAVMAAVELAADLARLGGEPESAVVSVMLPREVTMDTLRAMAIGADRAGGIIADHAWPLRDGELPIGIGIDPAVLLGAGANPGVEVPRLRVPVAAARLSDAGTVGRVAVGRGSLDVLAYEVALETRGYRRPLVVDVRGVRGQAEAATAAADGRMDS